jgi:hypothetical protein
VKLIGVIRSKETRTVKDKVGFIPDVRAELETMAGILADCSGQLAPTSEKAPPHLSLCRRQRLLWGRHQSRLLWYIAPEPAPTRFLAPAPATYVPPAPDPAAYYANCDAVRAAGASPLYAGSRASGPPWIATRLVSRANNPTLGISTPCDNGRFPTRESRHYRVSQ